MPNFNSVQLMGNLCRDIEIRHTSGNQAVANASMAINRKWRSADGQDREEVTFVDIEIWGKTAEAMAKYLKKGDPVFVFGRLKLDQWEDKEGKKQTKLRVVAEGFQFINGKPASESPSESNAKYDTTKQIRQSPRTPPATDDFDPPF